MWLNKRLAPFMFAIILGLTSQGIAAAKCNNLKIFLDLALNQSMDSTTALESVKRVHELKKAEKLFVFEDSGAAKQATIVDYKDGKLLYRKEGSDEILEQIINEDIAGFFRTTDEAVAAEDVRHTDSAVTGVRDTEPTVGDAPDGLREPEIPSDVDGSSGLVVRNENLPARRSPGDIDASGMRPDNPPVVPGKVVAPDVADDVVSNLPARRPNTEVDLPQSRPDNPVGRQNNPSSLGAVDGPDGLPARITGPQDRLGLAAPETPRTPETPSLPNERPNLGISATDDAIDGVRAPRQLEPPRFESGRPDVGVLDDVPSFQRTARESDFPNNIEDKVISFLSPQGKSRTTGRVIRVNKASVRVEVNGEIKTIPFNRINGGSISEVPKSRRLAARTDFPEELLDNQVTFFTPAGKVKQTGVVKTINEKSVVLEIDGELKNFRFRDIHGDSVALTKKLEEGIIPESVPRVGAADEAVSGASSADEAVSGASSADEAVSGASSADEPGTAIVLRDNGSTDVANTGSRDLVTTGGRDVSVPRDGGQPPRGPDDGFRGPSNNTGTDIVVAGSRAVDNFPTRLTKELMETHFTDEWIYFTSKNGDNIYGRFKRVENGDAIIDTAGGEIRVALDDIPPRGITMTDIAAFKEVDAVVVRNTDGTLFQGPFNAKSIEGRNITDTRVLEYLQDGARVGDVTSDSIEMVAKNGTRFRLPMQFLKDNNLFLGLKNGMQRLSPRLIADLVRSVGRARVLDQVNLAFADEEDTGSVAETNDDTGGEEEPGTPVENTTGTGDDEDTAGNDFQDCVGSDCDDEGTTTGGEDEEETAPLPMAPSGNPVGPNALPGSNRQIFIKRGVL